MFRIVHLARKRGAQHDKSELPALAAAFRMGVRRVLAERMLMLGQYFILAILFVSYAVLFDAVDPARLAPYGLTPGKLVFYGALGQLILASGYFYRDLEAAIHNGDLETALTRPVTFWAIKLAEWLGHYVTRTCLFAPLMLALAFSFAGDALPGLACLPALALSLLLAGGIFLCWHFAIGSLCVVMGQSEPFYRIWQKALFLFGARFWPLALYPLAMRRYAWLTPWPDIFAVPGNIAMGQEGVAAGLLHQMLWLVLSLALARESARFLRRRLEAEP